MTTKPSASKGARARTALAKGKSAAKRVAASTVSAGKKAAVRIADRNKDGIVDNEDAKIAGARAKQIGSKAAAGARNVARAAAKNDMVKDAAAGAAIGAVVAMPVPVVGPAAGAAIGAVVGVAKNLRSAGKPASGTTGKESKPSAVKSAMSRIRKPRQQDAPTSRAKPAKT